MMESPSMPVTPRVCYRVKHTGTLVCSTKSHVGVTSNAQGVCTQGQLMKNLVSKRKGNL